MPDIRKRRPDFKCNGDGHSLALYSDLLPFSDLSPIHYNYAIAILVDPGRLIGFITLERSQSMKNAFCFFDEKGEHHNFGDLSDEQPSDDLVLIGFISGAGMVLRDKFGIDTDGRWEPMGPVDKRYNALIQTTGSS
jgi:hypothetical protein